MSRTFLPRARAAGAAVLADAAARRVRRLGGRWLVELERAGGERLELEADAVVLACGAVQTPALLRRSGLSTRAGRSLSLHPMLKVVAELDAELSAGCAVEALQVKDETREVSLGCSASTAPMLAVGLVDHGLEPAARWRRLGSFYAMSTAIDGAGRGEVRPLPGFRDPLVRYRLGAREKQALSEGLRCLSRAL